MTIARKFSILPWMTAGVLLLPLLSTGCLGKPEGFAKKSAKFACIRFEECEKEFFDAEFDGDQGKCRDDVEESSLESYEQLEMAGCDYVAKEARACIKEARKNKKECSDSAAEDVAKACMDVFDCPTPGMELEQGEELPAFSSQPAAESIDPLGDAAFHAVR